MTWEILLLVAARVEGTYPTEATRLRLAASEVKWLEARERECERLEQIVNGLVAEGIEAEKARVVPLRSKHARERA